MIFEVVKSKEVDEIKRRASNFTSRIHVKGRIVVKNGIRAKQRMRLCDKTYYMSFFKGGDCYYRG